MTRPQPPELEPEMPPCPMCGKETWHDGDSFRCDPCGAYWNDVNQRGHWLDETIPQCPKILHHGGYPILSGRCMLPETHWPASEHWNGHTSWRSAKDWSSSTETEAVDLVK